MVGQDAFLFREVRRAMIKNHVTRIVYLQFDFGLEEKCSLFSSVKGELSLYREKLSFPVY